MEKFSFLFHADTFELLRNFPRLWQRLLCVIVSFASITLSQTIDIKGRVLDEELRPLSSARITVLPDSARNTFSDAQGHFSISDISGSSSPAGSGLQGKQPFIDHNRIHFFVPAGPKAVSLTLVDGSGRSAGTPVCQILSQGNHDLPLSRNTGCPAPGLYFIRLTVGKEIRTFRTLLIGERFSDGNNKRITGLTRAERDRSTGQSAAALPALAGIAISKSGYDNNTLYFATLAPGNIGDIVLGRTEAIALRNNGMVILTRFTSILKNSSSGAPPAFTIYYKNIVTGDISQHKIEVKSPFGEARSDRWYFDHSRPPAGVSLPKSFPFRILVKNSRDSLLSWGQTYITLTELKSQATHRMLIIGDSFVRDGTFIKHMADVLPNIKLQGIRHYDLEAAYVNREGRGGWSLARYLTFNTGNNGARYSPFMFPIGVEGQNYWGDTDFWSRVAAGDTSYSYYGFQKIARGWKEITAPYLFLSTGFPRQPALGDVLWAGPAGTFQRFDGTRWTAMSPQPSTELSFAKYQQRFSAAFEENGRFSPPQSICILLGTNEFRNGGTTDSAMSYWAGMMERLIASIREANPGIPIVIGLETSQGINASTPPDLIATAQAARANLQKLDLFMISRWDNNASAKNRIFLAPLLPAVDPVDGYASDPVHPNTGGYFQLGERFAGTLQYVRNLFY